MAKVSKEHHAKLLRQNKEYRESFQKWRSKNSYTKTVKKYATYLEDNQCKMKTVSLSDYKCKLFIWNRKKNKANEISTDNEKAIIKQLKTIRVNEAGYIRNSKTEEGGTCTYKRSQQLTLADGHRVQGYSIAALAWTSTASLKKLKALAKKTESSIITHHLCKKPELNGVTLLYDNPNNLRLHTKKDHDWITCEGGKKDWPGDRDHVPGQCEGDAPHRSPRELAEYVGITIKKLNQRVSNMWKKYENASGVTFPRSKQGGRLSTTKLYHASPHAFENADGPSIAKDSDDEIFDPLRFDLLRPFIKNDVTDDKLEDFIEHFQVSNQGRVRQSSDKHLTHFVKMYALNEICPDCEGENEGNCGILEGKRSYGPPPHNGRYGEQHITGTTKVRLPILFAIGLMPNTMEAALGNVNNDVKRIRVKVTGVDAGPSKPILQRNLHIKYKDNNNKWMEVPSTDVEE
jgi:hypothetical protein